MDEVHSAQGYMGNMDDSATLHHGPGIDQSPLPHRTALILYGSETGNAQDAAEELGRLAQRLRFSTTVTDLNSIQLAQLTRASLVIFTISTTGQGDLPINALSFWKSLRSVRLRAGCLNQVRFTIFGLGDSSYPRFNWASRKLRSRLDKLGAQSVFQYGEADEQHPEGIEGTFLPWSLLLREALTKQYELPTGIEPIPDDVLLQARWRLDYADVCSGDASGKVLDSSLTSRPNTFVATVSSNDRVTPTTHWQDVRHITFSTPELDYHPGDVAVIYPLNASEDVDAFINLMNWADIAHKPLSLMPTTTPVPENYPPPPIYSSDSPLTIHTLLTRHLDIMSIPRRSFFATLSHYTTDSHQRDRLLEFTKPDYLDELYDYTTRPRRSILEVLQEFDTVHLPFHHLLNIIPRLKGRQFSIASGGALKRAPSHPSSPSDHRPTSDPTAGRIELLVAIVQYRTVIKRLRRGTCTRYISALTPGTTLPLTLQRGAFDGSKPPATDLSKPMVLIGPGTGIAPIRALIHERALARAAATTTSTTANEAESDSDILFFGSRNAASDFFFRDEWAALPIHLHTAFSRDQRHKIYVQDLIRAQGESVYDALEKRAGSVFVCGSSGKMPRAVREALVGVFLSYSGGGDEALDRAGAEAKLEQMEREGRYVQETW